MRLGEDFRGRTKKYASSVIRLYAGLGAKRREVEVLGHQLLRSGTSVAANVREASRARTGNEFVSKLEVALQEADESQLWLELLREDCGLDTEEIRSLLGETNELIAILVTMIAKTKTSEKR